MDTVRETEFVPARLHPVADSVGRFKLVEKLGAGGMGEVFVAFDPQLERHVALKVLKLASAVDGAETERLLREANAMAKISHPNVVSVFDAGLDGAQPWVAMELIRGTTLREWLERKRTWQQTLAVLCQIARGLEAAHQAGLVHRDVKPENVLMGADGRVAVTDFGIAQASWAPPMPELTTPATPTSVRQRASTQGVLMGTPGYMAPEQYLRQATDARTDQFAFAVTAYEALWGELPFAGHTGDLVESAVEVVTSTARPPSAKGVPGTVWRALQRALEPKADRRHPSMGELRQQLERAMPGRRARWPVALGVTVPLALALAFTVKPAAVDPCAAAGGRLAGVWDGPARATLGEAFAGTHLAYADASWATARAGLDGYARDWQTMYGEACRATRVEGRQSEALMDLRMDCLERSRSVLTALIRVWSKELTPEVVQSAPDAVRGLPALEACADARALTERDPLPRDPAAAAQIATARAKVDAVTALSLADRRPEAKAAAAAARTEANATGWDQVRAEAALAEGKALADLEAAEAEPALLEAARLAGSSRDDRLAAESLIELVHHLAEDKQNASRALLVADLADGVLLRAGNDPALRVRLTRFRGAALFSQGSYPQAKLAFTTAHELARKRLGEHDWDTTANLGELARVAEAQGDYAEARRLGDEVVAAAIERFGPDNPTVASRLNNLAMAVDRGGDPEAAVAYHRRALAIKEKALGPDSASTATSLNNLAIILLHLGQLDEGQQLLERALAIRIKVLGPEHAYVATTLGNLATAYRSRGDFDKALDLLQQSLTLKTKAYGPVHANVANSLAELGQTYSAAGKETLALDAFHRALEVRTKALGPAHQQTLHASNLVASSLIALGRCSEARPMLEANVPALEKIEGGNNAALAEALTLRADCELARAHPEEARALLERALEIRGATHGAAIDLGAVHWGLGRARWALGQRAPAIEAVRTAEHELAGDASVGLTARAVKAWLATHRS